MVDLFSQKTTRHVNASPHSQLAVLARVVAATCSALPPLPPLPSAASAASATLATLATLACSGRLVQPTCSCIDHQMRPPSPVVLAALFSCVLAIESTTTTMPLLPTSHAAFIYPTEHTAISIARAEQRRRMQAGLATGAGPGGAMPFLMQSVAVNDGSVKVTRTFVPSKADEGEGKEEPITETYSIFTRVFRPMSMASRQAAPIVVLHGGPSVPPDYLYPLVDFVPYRCMVFYDQVGCGRSSQPKDINAYSIEAAVDDLEAVIKKLGLRRFHLYGQSYGGILAFEYLKRVAERKGRDGGTDDDDEGCLSVMFSSTPTSVALVEASAEGLLDNLKDEDDDEETLGDRFRLAHQCRLEPMPQPLVDAYAHAGNVWRGTTAIPNYEAEPPAEGASRMPSAMVMRGEHDFVDHACVEGWKSCFNHKFVRDKVLEGCAHHGLLESGRLYGQLINDFFGEYD